MTDRITLIEDITAYAADLVLCGTDILVILELMRRSFGEIRKHRYMVYAGMAALIFGIVTWGHLTGNVAVSFFIFWICIFVVGFYPPDFRKKILFCTALLSLNVSVLFVINDITNILPKGWYLYGLTAYHILFWGIVYLSMKFSENSGEMLTGKMWALLCAIPVLCLAGTAFTALLTGCYSGSVREAALLHLPVQMIFLAVNLLVFVLYRELTKAYAADRENALLLQQIEYQKRQYEENERADQAIREIRHEMKNQLRTLTTLYKNGEQAELGAYLEATTGRLECFQQRIRTGNLPADSLLNMKINEIEQAGICCNADVLIPSDLEFPLTDMIVILGNLFDNAREACVLLREDNVRNIRVNFSMNYTGGILLIHMDNPYGEFSEKTRKEEADLHGLGLKNVERTVRRLRGMINYSARDHLFSVDIMVRFPQEEKKERIR